MLIKVRVFPVANKNNVVKKSENVFDVFTKAKPALGMANKAVVKLLAEHLEISEKNIRIVRGHKQPSKIIEIHV